MLGNYAEGTNREWLLSNGLGSFCSGSINGNLARSYHGMFIKSFIPPLNRMMTFHKIEESLNETDLFTYKTIDASKEYIHKGFKNIESFEINPFPKWIFSINGTILEKEIFMPFEREMVVTKYRILASAREVNKLDTNLFFDYRDYHEVLNRNKFDLRVKDNQVSFADKSIYIYTNGQLEELPFTEEKEDFYGNTIPGSIRKNIAYDIELDERGGKDLGSSYNLLKTSISLKKGEDFYIIASFDKLNNTDLDINLLYQHEIERINKLKDMTSKEDKLLRDLAVACDDFITYRKGIDGKTILAGYPWFGDWGRDTMIALPGLTLSTGRFEDARSILKTFARYCSDGMLPNVFPAFEGEKLQYNTIDAAPWYFFAVLKYLEYTNDYSFIEEEIYPTLKDIVSYHIKGTRYNIHIDENGFLNGGGENTQLTWMDVKYKDWAVTPRYGKPVEIQALWYNGMKLMEKLSEKFREDNQTYTNLANRLKENFEKEFWNEKDQCLYDYIGGEKNSDIRPNQIFVISLPHSLLTKEKEKLIVDRVFKDLYTSKGLKSLDKNNPHYKGVYFGNLYERDSCYHQGTVWAWPMGHFIGAYNKVYKNKSENKILLNGLIHHFYGEGCINSISEIFDGDKPFKARGCFAQAWSVSELLRALKEYC
nr:amylo-alpha-1,6-glucosidase [Psychrilyobacter atlanticus]